MREARVNRHPDPDGPRVPLVVFAGSATGVFRLWHLISVLQMVNNSVDQQSERIDFATLADGAIAGVSRPQVTTDIVRMKHSCLAPCAQRNPPFAVEMCMPPPEVTQPVHLIASKIVRQRAT